MSRHVDRRSRALPTVAVLVTVLATAGGGVAAARLTGLWPDGGPAAVAATSSSPTASASPTPTATPTPTPPPDTVLTVVAAGDVLTHEAVMIDARTDAGYDFSAELAPVDAWVAGADLALCHMEVPVAPAGVAPSGYPLFGAPAELARDLAEAGWDGCSTASNHSVDRGEAGVVATLDAFDAVGLGHAGTARTAEEAATTQVYRFDREGQTVTVAHISATYGTNGMPVAAPHLVDLIDADAIIAEATAARAAGADLVLVSVHCCVEYVAEPAAQQVEVAQALADSGVVDLVIGHHAHVPQPVARLSGGPDGSGMWVAYGLGNFISNQGGWCCASATDSGLLMTATIRKPVDGPARVEQVGWTAITVDLSDHTVWPMLGGAAVGSLSAEDVAARYARVTAVVGTQAPEVLTPPTSSGPPPGLDRLATG